MKNKTNNNFKLLMAGIFFAILWASASAATKIGLQSAQPFVMAVTRFFYSRFYHAFFIAYNIKKKAASKK